jgi:RNA polymerase sigma-70 factor (ECF subfamily)
MNTEQWIIHLVELHEKPLCRYARSLCGDDATARDAVQETFLRLCKAKRKKIEGHEAAWLYRVCCSRVLDIKKKEKPMHYLSEKHEVVLSAEQRSPHEQVALKDSESLIPGMMNRLPARHKEAVRLKFEQNLSYREIASVLDITESNVGFILHTALTSLREQMKQAQGVHS